MRISTNPQFVLSNPAEKTGSIATGLLGAALGTDHSYEWSVPQIQRITTTKATTVAATDTSAVRDF